MRYICAYVAGSRRRIVIQYLRMSNMQSAGDVVVVDEGTGGLEISKYSSYSAPSYIQRQLDVRVY